MTEAERLAKRLEQMQTQTVLQFDFSAVLEAATKLRYLQMENETLRLERAKIVAMFDKADLFVERSFDGGATNVPWPFMDRVRLAIEASLDDSDGNQIKALRAALDQLLDDMGDDGLYVCEDAKSQAIAAMKGKP